MRSHDRASEVALICPSCRLELIHAKSYRYLLCGSEYPFHGGVLRMLGRVNEQERNTRAAFDFEHRQFERAQYLRIHQRLIENWLLDVQLPSGYFPGRTVLDVGCGSGRWTYALVMLGDRVIAVDFTDAAVDIMREVTKSFPNVEVIQANLFRLPFRPEQFDFIVSWGCCIIRRILTLHFVPLHSWFAKMEHCTSWSLSGEARSKWPAPRRSVCFYGGSRPNGAIGSAGTWSSRISFSFSSCEGSLPAFPYSTARRILMRKRPGSVSMTGIHPNIIIFTVLQKYKGALRRRVSPTSKRRRRSNTRTDWMCSGSVNAEDRSV